MRFIPFFLLFLFLLIQLPQLSFTKNQCELALFSTLYAGQAPRHETIRTSLPSKKIEQKPNYLTIWKERRNSEYFYPPEIDDDLVAALLAFFLGMWGAHKFYQGNMKMGFVMAGITLLGIVLCFTLIFMIPGIMCILATYIWSLIDFVRILAKIA